MTAVTIDQLAQLYQAANQANSDLAAAYRNRDTAMIGMLRDRSRELNRSYAAAKRRRKRQQKSSGRDKIRTTMVRWYLDQQACNAPAPAAAAAPA